MFKKPSLTEKERKIERKKERKKGRNEGRKREGRKEGREEGKCVHVISANGDDDIVFLCKPEHSLKLNS